MVIRLALCAATCCLLGAEEKNPGASAENNPEQPAAVVPAYTFTTDSDGNLRQITRLDSAIATISDMRLNFVFGQTRVSNKLDLGREYHPESYRTMGAAASWKTGSVFSVDGEALLTSIPDTTWPDGDTIDGQHTITGKVVAHLKSNTESFLFDLGFGRSLHDLTPELMVNRVIRNEAILRGGVALPAGWRLRGRGDWGLMTGTGERNRRYNSELTIAHKLGTDSEWNVSYGNLHYSKESSLGYYSPDQVHTVEGGWSTEVQGRYVGLSVDTAIGFGRAKAHSEEYGPLGLSVRGQVDLKWRMPHGRELCATSEYYYNQFNPALQISPSTGWSMTSLSISFRWAYPQSLTEKIEAHLPFRRSTIPPTTR